VAVVVGNWMSDDDEKIPLGYLKDDDAKVGFSRRMTNG
jgi:hypothetical protein